MIAATLDLARGLWWLWLFGGAFLVAFALGLCRAAAKPAPSLVLDEATETVGWALFEAPEFVEVSA